MSRRPITYCETCEGMVYADDVHSCYDAKAVREHAERERALNVSERAELVRLREQLATVDAEREQAFQVAEQEAQP